MADTRPTRKQRRATAMTVRELKTLLRDIDDNARVVIAREPRRISQRAKDAGEMRLCGDRNVLSASESCDGDEFAIIFGAP